MHLLFNAFTFWAFAFGLERAIGSERFFWLYAVGLLASDFGTWIRHRHQPEYRTLGASGAITAVLFASIVYFPNGSIYILPIPVPIPSPLFALAYLAYTWFAVAPAGRAHQPRRPPLGRARRNRLRRPDRRRRHRPGLAAGRRLSVSAAGGARRRARAAPAAAPARP